MLKWLKWFFWDCRRCQHDEGGWHMRDLGMSKARHCRKCGKCLELI